MKSIKHIVSRWLSKISRVTRLRTYYQHLGFYGTFVFFLAEKLLGFYSIFSKSSSERIYRLYARDLKYPIYCRKNSTDRTVFWQIFVRRDYSITPNSPPKLIIDCGAYVGYSTAFFLSQYPNAHIIAVEPDSDNYHLLQQNMSPYKDQVELIRAGIWNQETGIMIDDCSNGDKGKWAIRVRKSKNDEKPDLMGITMEKLLSQSSFERIDILKMDVEGAEKIVFENCDNWINKVDAICIELHGASCRRAFYDALEISEYSFYQTGSTLVVIRNHL